MRARILITGRVQGVFFRDWTRAEAERLGVTGWVRNLPDGRVEAVAEGEEDTVATLIDRCRHGSPPSRVDDVDVSYEQSTGEYPDFTITY